MGTELLGPGGASVHSQGRPAPGIGHDASPEDQSPAGTTVVRMPRLDSSRGNDLRPSGPGSRSWISIPRGRRPSLDRCPSGAECDAVENQTGGYARPVPMSARKEAAPDLEVDVRGGLV